MTITELIVRAARRLLEGDAALMGVRVCPITLEPSDVEPLRKEIQATIGKRTFLALSIPGAKTFEADRFYVSGDQSSAERATRWRNVVKIDEGEHLVYVSVQVHGKAGGLQDCLTPIHEDDLRAEFVEWCDGRGSGMPSGSGAALSESGILARSSAVALCEFATAVLRDRRDDKWEAMGHSLPLLNLARDGGLRPSNATGRLAENERAVSRAATGERTAGVSKGPLAQLREVFRAVADDVQDGLKRIDLTEHLSDALNRKRSTKRARLAPRQPKQPKERRTSRKAPKSRQDPTELLVDAAQTGGDPLAEVEKRARRLAMPTGPGNDPSEESGAEASDSPDEGLALKVSDNVWTRAQQASEFGALAGRVPLGLSAMLLQSLNRDGFGLLWAARESAKALLDDLPAHAPPRELSGEIADPVLRTALEQVIERRRTASALLLVDAEHGLRALSTFISAPLVSLAERNFRAAAAALLDSYARLYQAAAATPDVAGRRVAFALDTIEVRARSGDAVLIVGPLHPLWLSQALGRFEALLTQADLSPTAKRLLVRSLSEAPVAPERWPSADASPLQLSRPIGGLIAFQSTPDELEPRDVADAVGRVVSLFADNLPHARFGLRVAVLGGVAGPVVDGVAAALADRSELDRIVVHYRGGGLGDYSSRTEAVVASGRLAFDALPAAGSELGQGLKPHIVFHLAPPNAAGVALQTTVPGNPGLGASSGLLPTEFTVVDGGLRARTPIDQAKFPALGAFEALHALMSGSQPQGAFARSALAVSLRALLQNSKGPDVSWDVVLASRVGRRPPDGMFLLSHERPTDQLSVAITSRDLAPAGRALRDAFRALGVEDLRPLVLNNLAIHLASVTNQGVISPFRTGEQVLAASVLGMALRRELAADEAYVAHLDGGSATTLLGQDPNVQPGAFAIGFGAVGEQLRVVLGYAALKESVGVDILRGQLAGPLQDLLFRLSSSVALAASADGVGAVAAREALNWVLWPALAAAERAGSRTEQLLLRLDKGVQCAVNVVAYLPPGTPALRHAAGAKLGKVPVSLRALDVGTFEALVFGREGTGAARR